MTNSSGISRPTESFSVKSAYQVARARKNVLRVTSSDDKGKAFWQLIWTLDVPPRIKLFAWKVGVGVGYEV